MIPVGVARWDKQILVSKPPLKTVLGKSDAQRYSKYKTMRVMRNNKFRNFDI